MKPTRLQTTAIAITAALALAACAGEEGAGTAASSTSLRLETTTRGTTPPTTEAPPTSQAPPTTAKPEPPPSTKPGGDDLITVTGTVADGVEAGCLILRADSGKVWLLVGGNPSELRSGARVRVTGEPAPDLLSYCQQGEPFSVQSVSPVR